MSEEAKEAVGRNFSSNSSKYLAKVNRQRLRQFEAGRGLPKMIHVSPTDRCNIRCFYCSSDKRDGDTMDLEYIFDGVDRLLKYAEEKDLSPLQSVEITGGGDPQQYKYINELIVGLHNRGLKIGMISNAEFFTKNVRPDASKLLTWLRCSVNWKPREGVPMIEWPAVFPQLPAPGNIGRPETMGFSIVMSAGFVPDHKTGEDRWLETPKEHFEYALSLAKIYGAAYVRVVTNCLGRHADIDRAIEKFRGWVDAENQGNGLLHGKVYWQHKYPTAPEHAQCFTGYFRPFVNSDGWVYPCSSCTLSEEQFPKSLRVAQFHELTDWYEESYRYFAEHGKIRPVVADPANSSGCVNCTFKDNVYLLEKVARIPGWLDQQPEGGDVEHEEFI